MIFTRWDHLQRDQQADAGTYGATNYASEAAGAADLHVQTETFPESRVGMGSAYGPVGGFTFNLFTPWQMNQDGTEELTLNHIGRQELSFGYLTKSFSNDPALSEYSNTALIANKKYIRMDGGLFHVREDQQNPGTYYAIYTREFGTLTSNQIVRISGAPTLNAEQMTIVDASPAADSNGNLPGGRFRDPLPLAGGQMVAAYTASPSARPGIQLRLQQLNPRQRPACWSRASRLRPGIVKNISWWDPDTKREFNGALWEIEPVEVVGQGAPVAPPPGTGIAGEIGADRRTDRRGHVARLAEDQQPRADRDPQPDQPRSRRQAAAVQPSGAGRDQDPRRRRQGVRHRPLPDPAGQPGAWLRQRFHLPGKRPKGDRATHVRGATIRPMRAVRQAA